LQVFRGLDVGSAKVTPEEAGSIKHHLLDVVDVNSEEGFSVASFCALAQEAIQVSAL
jgi:tRNA dimethylallyltransferase